MNATSKSQLRNRLLRVALEEVHNLLKPLKKNYPQLKDFIVSFQDVPNNDLLSKGVKGDCDSYYYADQQELVIFLFSIYEQAKEADEFRRRVRAALLKKGLTSLDVSP